MQIEVSNGEIIDKLTIVQIKLENISDEEKRRHLFAEYEVLLEAAKSIIDNDHPHYLELLELNRKLWIIEDQIRDLERAQNFGPSFIELARSVYFTNDLRAEAKRKINLLTNSGLVEVKSYQPYA